MCVGGVSRLFSISKEGLFLFRYKKGGHCLGFPRGLLSALSVQSTC